MTPFLEAHPGGVTRIQMVNGQDLKAFWEVYKIHNRPHIQALLQDYRVYLSNSMFPNFSVFNEHDLFHSSKERNLLKMTHFCFFLSNFQDSKILKFQTYSE